MVRSNFLGERLLSIGSAVRYLLKFCHCFCYHTTAIVIVGTCAQYQKRISTTASPDSPELGLEPGTVGENLFRTKLHPGRPRFQLATARLQTSRPTST